MQKKPTSTQKIIKNKTLSQFEMQKNQTIKFCINHNEKKAKYQFFQQNESQKTTNQKNLLCSKCAIQYATKGFQIVEINLEVQNKVELIKEQTSLKVDNMFNFDQNQRSLIIEQLLQSLQVTQKESQNAKQQVASRKADILYFYEQQIIKLDKTYDQVLKIIEQAKINQLTYLKSQTQKQLLNIFKQYSSTITQFLQIENNLDQNIQKMQQLIEDIEENINQIINNIENKPFKAVVQQQNDNLQKYYNYNKDIQQQQIVTESLQSSKDIEVLLNNLNKQILDMFSLKKTQRNLIKSQTNNDQSTLVSIEISKGHEKTNSDLPKNIIFKNEEDKKMTMEIIKNAKKKSLSELSPIVQKEGYRRDYSSNYFLDKENIDNFGNGVRSKTPNINNQEDAKKCTTPKMFSEKVYLTPTNKDFSNLIKKKQY